MKKLIRILISAVALTMILESLSVIVLFASVSAAPGLNVKNDIINVQIQPGQSYVHTMIVINGSTTDPLDLTVEADGLGQGLDGSNIILPASLDSSSHSARTFITNIDKTSFHLDPNGSQDVDVTITVPNGTAPGEKYAAIYIYSKPIGQDKVGIRLASIVPVIITIPGFTSSTNGQITEVNVPNAVTDQSIEIDTILKNTGNVRLDTVTDFVTLSNASGKTILNTQKAINPPSILPGFSRMFTVYDSALAKGNYTVKSVIKQANGTTIDSKTINFSVVQSTVTSTTTGTTVTTTANTSPTISTTTTPNTTPSEDYSLPGLDPNSIVVINADQPNPYVNAIDKAGVEIQFMGVQGSGTIIVGKYIQTPQTLVAFSDGVIKGGMGKPAVKYVNIRVKNYNQGTAHVTVYYNKSEIKGFDVNSLFLAYFSGDKWHKCENPTNSPDNNSVSGDIPVIRLTGGIIGLGGDYANSSNQTSFNGGNGFPVNNGNSGPSVSWFLALAVILPIVVIGIIFVIIMGKRKKNQRDSTVYRGGGSQQ